MDNITENPSSSLDLVPAHGGKRDKVPAGLTVPRPVKPLTADRLLREFPVSNGLCFRNQAEAKAPMDCALWKVPENDDTIPQTDADEREIVKGLVVAFKDMTSAKDTAKSAYRHRFTPGMNQNYPDWAIEACAWDIVRMVKIVHTEGFKAPIYDKTILNCIGATQHWTFKDRIDWISAALKTSKNIAVTLMKQEKVWTTIGAPHKLLHSTLTNTISNAHRNDWVKVGRDADIEFQNRPNKRRKIAVYKDSPVKDTGLEATVGVPREENSVESISDTETKLPTLVNTMSTNIPTTSTDTSSTFAKPALPPRKFLAFTVTHHTNKAEGPEIVTKQPSDSNVINKQQGIVVKPQAAEKGYAQMNAQEKEEAFNELTYQAKLDMLFQKSCAAPSLPKAAVYTNETAEVKPAEEVNDISKAGADDSQVTTKDDIPQDSTVIPENTPAIKREVRNTSVPDAATIEAAQLLTSMFNDG